MIKEINKVDLDAVATLLNGVKALVHLRAIEIGGDTITPLRQEDASVTLKVALEYLDENDLPTGSIELYNKLDITTKRSQLQNSNIESVEFKEWFTDEICGLHKVEVVDEM